MDELTNQLKDEWMDELTNELKDELIKEDTNAKRMKSWIA